MNMAPSRQKILVVDDERINRQALADLLTDDYDVVLAKNGAQALEKANAHQPDLILLDVVMPEMDGYEVLRTLKEDDATRDIAVIIVSGLDSTSDEVKGLTLGALDYVTKPFHPTIVKSRVRNILDVVEHRKLIEEQVNLDVLTGINNRRKFDETLIALWRAALRRGGTLALAMIDVDCFKQYNDTYGHAQGDEVLRKVARAIVSSLKRPDDFGARYGGEEFVLLLPETDVAGGRVVTERICRAVEALGIPHRGSVAHDAVTVSIGGAVVQPVDGEYPRILLQAADRMLYRAKGNGRNQVAW